MNKDQVKGNLKQAEGTIKEVTGKVIGNKNLEEKGKLEKHIGKVQESYGDVKDDIKKGI
ncbi:CsbD family protein [Herminiimonas glaciei]|uniref:CsbD family protein n=1 Tax=Herminiimonas glaciei TaxID=523788 RepID=A0ABW2IAW4_9BURK